MGTFGVVGKTSTCVWADVEKFFVDKSGGPGRFVSMHFVSRNFIETREPVMELCVPPVACYGYNMCARPYVDHQCLSCRFKYFRDAKSQICVPCGFTQVLASLLMSGASVMAGVGGFLGMMLLLKFKSDLKFKITLKLVFKVRIARPLAAEFWGGNGPIRILPNVFQKVSKSSPHSHYISERVHGCMSFARHPIVVHEFHHSP